LTAFSVRQLRLALAELATSPKLLIDISGVLFVDSARLDALIGGIRRARGAGRQRGSDMQPAHPDPLAALDRLRPDRHAETVEEAAAALGPPDDDASHA
jgi:anti-sigma B factor antagonist